KRELKEETGIIARSWTKLFQIHLSNSATDEKAIIYLAQDLEFTNAEPEETEDLALTKLALQSFIEMILNGQITDAITVTAGLWLDRMISKREIN
ncbi:MAG TPA: NUDIX hydrolase, partial [Saprospiraceae bacterium]|nr:NUDIX hydrolase [Saprospiraceae bacterium]